MVHHDHLASLLFSLLVAQTARAMSTHEDAHDHAYPRYERERAPRVDEHARREQDGSEARAVQPRLRAPRRLVLART